MTFLWFFSALFIVYVRFYRWKLPQKAFFADYQVHFYDIGFEVEGRNYKRPYTYNQIANFIVKKSYLIFVTDYEGMILPVSVFSTVMEKEEFIEDLQKNLKK